MATQNVTIQFANTQSGKNVDVSIVPNGTPHKVSDLVASANSDLAFVTEIQLLAGRQNVTAVVTNSAGQQLASIDGNADNVEQIARTAVGQLVVEATKAA